jgi:hypothetical protein
MSNQVEQFREKLQELVEDIRKELDADIVTMYLYDVEHGRPFFPIGSGLRDIRTFKRGIPDLNRAVGDIIKGEEPIFANNVLNHTKLIGPFVYREGVRSVALLPLTKSSGNITGLIYINYRRLTPFDDELKQKIRKQVKKLGATVEKELAIYTKDEPLYKQIAPAESQTRLEIILQQSVESVQNSLGSVSVAIWMPDEEGNLTLEYAANIHEIFSSTQIPLDSKDFTAISFKNQETTKIATIEGSQNFLLNDIAKALRWRAAMAVALVAPNYRSSLGVLSADTIDLLLLTRCEEPILDSFAASCRGV